MEIANGGRLDSWIDANLKWLRETFGNENLVSCVLHMDEKTPHLHATVVPIVAGERVRRKRAHQRQSQNYGNRERSPACSKCSTYFAGMDDLEKAMKEARKSPEQGLFITGMFPSGKRAMYAVDLTQE